MEQTSSYIPKDKVIRYPGTLAQAFSIFDDVFPRIQPGLNFDFTNRLDSDLSQKRTFIANTSLYFDSMFSPQGTISYSTSLSDFDKNKFKTTANYINNMIISETSFKLCKKIGLNFSFMLPSDMKNVPIDKKLSDEYNATAIIKRDNSSITTSAVYKTGIKTFKLSILRSILPGLSIGSKISINHSSKFSNNILLFAKYNKFKFGDILQACGDKNEYSIFYLKNLEKEKCIATKLTYNKKSNDSFWSIGYSFNFNDSGARVSTSIDSNLKINSTVSSRVKTLPINITLCTEMDHYNGQHKLGFIFQAISNSKEELNEGSSMV